jgi:DNA modification methylase
VSRATLHCGDVRDVLRSLPAESVQCVVTSPPYWGLRDYGTATWEGGDPGCDHLGEPKRTQSGFNERYFGKPFDENKQGDLRIPFGHTCGKCPAVRVDNQLGLERTPEEYVANMVAVFREVRRVLRPDGVCWLNLGDSYAGSWGNQGRNTAGPQAQGSGGHPLAGGVCAPGRTAGISAATSYGRSRTRCRSR